MCRCSLHCSNIDGHTRTHTIKYLSLVFIVIFLLHGFITVSVSIWLEVLNVIECNFLQEEAYWLPVHIQLSTGCLIVVVCIISVVYTVKWRGNGFFRIFTCLLVIVVVLEILSGIIAGVMNRKSENHLKQGMSGSVQAISNTANHNHRNVQCWVRLQSQYKCCGIDDYTTWTISQDTNSSITLFNSTIHDIWRSCNCDSQSGESCHNVNGQYKYSSGCFTELKAKVDFVITFTRFFGPAFAMVQLVAFFALYVIFMKMHKQSVVAIYKAKDEEDKQSCDNLHIFTVS